MSVCNMKVPADAHNLHVFVDLRMWVLMSVSGAYQV